MIRCSLEKVKGIVKDVSYSQNKFEIYDDIFIQLKCFEENELGEANDYDSYRHLVIYLNSVIITMSTNFRFYRQSLGVGKIENTTEPGGVIFSSGMRLLFISKPTKSWGT